MTYIWILRYPVSRELLSLYGNLLSKAPKSFFVVIFEIHVSRTLSSCTRIKKGERFTAKHRSPFQFHMK